MGDNEVGCPGTLGGYHDYVLVSEHRYVYECVDCGKEKEYGKS